MTSNNFYQIWLSFNGEKEKIRLPVMPETVKISRGSKDQSVDIVGLGEILLAQNRPATEISFSSFFPKTTFPGIAVQEITAPTVLRDKIVRWKESYKPVRLVITKLGVSTYFRITKFQTSSTGGDVGTIYYDITLKEYREPTVRKVSVNPITKKATVVKGEGRTDNTISANTYTVKKGDSLWKIAKKELGSGLKFSQIYKLNKDKIKNPFKIYPGQILRLK